MGEPYSVFGEVKKLTQISRTNPTVKKNSENTEPQAHQKYYTGSSVNFYQARRQ
ncbi:MAG: hypothetical protein GY740_18480 [Gammaproteobacteria bacterium]|nr:hypothetical protein [Gammaproteobacteria bacterium]